MCAALCCCQCRSPLPELFIEVMRLRVKFGFSSNVKYFCFHHLSIKFAINIVPLLHFSRSALFHSRSLTLAKWQQVDHVYVDFRLLYKNYKLSNPYCVDFRLLHLQNPILVHSRLHSPACIIIFGSPVQTARHVAPLVGTCLIISINHCRIHSSPFYVELDI